MRASESTPQIGAIPRAADTWRCGIVVARFNPEITERLLAGALSVLDAAGVTAARRTVIHVPGAFEIPVVAAALARQKDCAGLLCLGCVIRGATTHYEHICRTVTDALQRIAIETLKPVINGVLTVETVEQAEERAGGVHGNLGEYGARAWLEMCGVMDGWSS